MMRWIPVALALALTACSSTPETNYYQLPAGNRLATVSSQVDAGRPTVWVEHVSVPDYLAGNGVVYQSSDVQYVIASNNLWASPLDQQLQQTLLANLSQALPGSLVSASPLGQQQDKLNVNVTGFHGRYDGQAIVSGEWVLEHQGKIEKRSFALTMPQNEDGYDALVRTLAKGWQQEANEIANAIRNNQ
ncbi:membrane integrity-associated transporter subunit PqiC [Erwinia sp. 9145]|uniref:membrane integrity-associated transporter subunit PqiC n=1 Tax=Erwinia sp. 9145 TaxID=1500895 RepID=UPI000553D1FB|nr:membrane integrity-associated transporter subunit PqiC [Erwinia sp. 9145]